MRERIAIVDINTKKFKAISYKQYDENNILQIVVVENGKLVGLSNYSAVVCFQLPSGKVYEIPSVIENNTIKIVLTKAILNESGKVIVEVELSNSTQIITTFSIYLNVEKSINKETSQDPNEEEKPDIDPLFYHTHENKDVLDRITEEKIIKWDSLQSFSGDYNDLINKPIIPSIDGLATEDYVKNEIEKDLDDYATKNELETKANITDVPTNISQLVNDSGYLSSIPKEYITEEELEAKKYLTEHQDISGKADKSELFSKDYNDLINKPTIPSVDGLATEDYVKNEIAKAQLEDGDIDLSGYATKDELNSKANISDIPTKISDLTNDSNYLTEVPSEYITETELEDKGYLTEHQDLSNYPTKEEVNEAIESIDVSEQLKDLATKEEVNETNVQVDKNSNDISKILEIIDEPPTYTKPTLSISSSPSNIEHNVQTNITLTPKFTQNDAGSITSYILKKGNEEIYSNTSANAYTDTITLQHNASVTYSATVHYGDGVIKNTLLGISYPETSIKEGDISNNVTVRCYALSYYGIIDGTTLDGIDNLTSILRTSKGSTLTFNMVNQRVVYMYPKSFGNLTSIKDANNFDYINSYTLSNMTLNDVEYNVYILTDAVTINGFKQIFN